MEGSTLITINPATLDDENLWSYADLRSLCKNLSLGAKGKRLDLVDRLQSWHKLRIDNRAGLALHESESDEINNDNWIPLNVDGSNFSILSQNITARDKDIKFLNDSPERTKKKLISSLSPRRRSSMGTRGGKLEDTPPLPQRSSNRRRESMGLGLSEHPCNIPMAIDYGSAHKLKKSLLGFNSTEKNRVSPTLLKPLTVLHGTVSIIGDVTPGKSALKCKTSPRPSASKIHFSPFNGTKVIPNRNALRDREDKDESPQGGWGSDESSDEDEDGEDWDENYVDAVARLNAERNTQLAEDSDSDDSDCNQLWERID